jgi:hypothetical protein
MFIVHARRSRTLALALLVAAVAHHAACTPAAQRADCEPVAGSGCGDDERCVVDAAGEPVCVSKPPIAKLDEACTARDACPAGTGCVAVDGRAVCRTFCNPLQPSGALTCRDDAEARCVGTVDAHPEIGVCVRACATPGDVEAACAPAGAASACWIPPGLDFAVCSGVAGALEVGDDCSANARCAVGLLCTPRGEGATCRAVAPCEVGDFEVEFPGAPRHSVCTPCQAIAGPQAGEADDVRYLVCKADDDAVSGSARCLAEGGALVPLARSGAATLAEAAQAVIEGGVLFSGGCFVDGEASDCETGHAVCRVRTAR